jgi:mRNA interferase MazF
MQKEFDRWNRHKKTVQDKTFADYVHAREVWWCALGVNVGSEQDGSGDFFERPVLVLRKFNKNAVLVVPLSRTRKRTRYHVAGRHQGIEFAAIISQVRLVSTKRLTRKIYQMDRTIFAVIVAAVQAMIGGEGA